MRKLTIAALLGAQMLGTAPPALAADFVADQQVRGGAFGGLRLRVPFGGNARENRVRAGLALAPTLSTRARNGESRMRIGEGFELGVTGREPVRLLLAGRDLRRLGAAQDNDRGGPSTLAWIAIGVGVSVGILVAAVALCMDDSDCNPSE